MIYITNTRNTRIMWTVWAIVMVALLSALSNYAGLPTELPEPDYGDFTDSGVGCIDDCLDTAEQAAARANDNLHLSIQGE